MVNAWEKYYQERKTNYFGETISDASDIIKILDIFNQPWAVLSLHRISLVWFLLYFSILGFAIWFLEKKQKPKFLGY